MDRGDKKCNSQTTLFQTWGLAKTSNSSLQGPARPSLVEVTNRQSKSNDGASREGTESDNNPELFPMDFDDNDDDLLTTNLEEFVEDSVYLESKFVPVSEPEEIPGFDKVNGSTYIYPTNYPTRAYQFEIIKRALISNTLVVLPTGLGKTFLAAVVMYNFYRWYPSGKIVFMAPTKPLVAQQIEACFKIMGIPQKDTSEMTGSLLPNKREALWREKRVFFLTPQILQNDLSRGSCSALDFVCLVFDEAHRALGNHAYCQVIREVSGYHSNFRVLALSATPGDDMKAIQSVVSNLLISHVELRSEESPDIQPYVHGRNIEKIVIPLSDDLKKTKTAFLQVLETVVNRLYCQRVIWQRDPERISKFLLLKAREQFRADGTKSRQNTGMIEGDFGMAISLVHAKELLQQHGILSFYNFLKGVCEGSKGTPRTRTELKRNETFAEMMTDLYQRLENPDEQNTALNSSFSSSLSSPKRRLLKSIPKPNSSFSSHPKLQKLEEIVVDHFSKFHSSNSAIAASQTPTNTRIMIFSQYRDSVQEITAILTRHSPLVKVMSFIGQSGAGKNSRGLSQKEQIEVVERFRHGGYNTLVSTSVGEEGLDIGDVDLIICFDASHSPIRLVQRMGRTGRKRAGRIVILVTEGKEEQIYKKSLSTKKNIHKTLLNASKSLELYEDAARMIPRHLNPRCHKMRMSVGEFNAPRGKKRKSESSSTTSKKKTIIDAFTGKRTEEQMSGVLSPAELAYYQEHFKIDASDLAKEITRPVTLSNWLPWQTTPQPYTLINHSSRTHRFCEVLEFIDLHRDPQDGLLYHKELLSHLRPEDILNEEHEQNRGNQKTSNSRKKSFEQKSRKSSKSGNSDVTKNGKHWRQYYMSGFNQADDTVCHSDFDLPSLVPELPTIVPQTLPKECDEANSKDNDHFDSDGLVTYKQRKNGKSTTEGTEDVLGNLSYSETVDDICSSANRHCSDAEPDVLNEKLCSEDVSPKLEKDCKASESLLERDRIDLLPSQAWSNFLPSSPSPGKKTSKTANLLIDDWKTASVPSPPRLCNLSDTFDLGLGDENGDHAEMDPVFPIAPNLRSPAVRDQLETRNGEGDVCDFPPSPVNDIKAMPSPKEDFDSSNVLFDSSIGELNHDELDNLENKQCSFNSENDRGNQECRLKGVEHGIGFEAQSKCPTDDVKSNNSKRKVTDETCLPNVSNQLHSCSLPTTMPNFSISTSVGKLKNFLFQERAPTNSSSKDVYEQNIHSTEVFSNSKDRMIAITTHESSNVHSEAHLLNNGNHCPKVDSPRKDSSTSQLEVKVAFKQVGSSDISCERDRKDLIDDLENDLISGILPDDSILDFEMADCPSPPIVSMNDSIVCDDVGQPTANENDTSGANGKSSAPSPAINRTFRTPEVTVPSNEKILTENGEGIRNDQDDIAESPIMRKQSKRRRVQLIMDETVEESDVDACNLPTLQRTDSSPEDDKSFRRPTMKVLRRNTRKSKLVNKTKGRISIDTSFSTGDDDDFEEDQSFIAKRRSPCKTTDVKQNRRKKRPSHNEFIEYEAEETGSDRDEEEEHYGMDGYLLDSFIDDSTQVTQKTPARKTGNKGKTDMQAIYRQSLISPLCPALNFQTPAFRANRNRFKLVQRDDWNSAGEDSEAEEVMGLIESEEDISYVKGDSSTEEHMNHSINESCTETSNQVVAKKGPSRFERSPIVTHTKRRRVRMIESSDEEGPDNDDLTKLTHTNSTVNLDPVFNSIKQKLEMQEKNLLSTETSGDISSIECNSLTFNFGLDWLFESEEEFIKRTEPQSTNQAAQVHTNTKPDAKNETLSRRTPSLEMNDDAMVTSTSPPVIVLDSRVVGTSQISTLLRLKEKAKTMVAQQIGCDFIISLRKGVLRRSVSDISNSSNALKLYEALRAMRERFEKICVIIEKDRLKGNAAERKLVYTKHFSKLLLHLAECKIQVLFSDNQEETSELLASLSCHEIALGYGITHMPNISDYFHQFLKAALTIPRLNYAMAVDVCKKARTIARLIKSKPEELLRRSPSLPKVAAIAIFKTFKHEFELEMYGQRKKSL